MRFTWADSSNESLYSQQASLAVDANKLLTVTVPTFPLNVDYAKIYVGTVSGSETFISQFPTSGGTFQEMVTFVDGDSNSGQKVLSVDDTDNFNEGDFVIIHAGGIREETKTIDSITDGVSLTMTENLTYTHAAIDTDSVRHAVDEGASLPSENTLEETVTVKLESKPKIRRVKPLYYAVKLVMVEDLSG